MSLCETPSQLSQSPGLPKSPAGDPVFPEPWAAEAFAMTVHLHEKGVFTWSEWAAALSTALHRPGRAEDGSDYFDCWVEALSDLLVSRGVADASAILALQKSWQRAAEATPHGKPIELGNDPLR
ncbi:nitrile hydratase accessory protein [Rhizobium leguminosarum]|uniref:Nitrile hydratase accessory protein n=1 Tax=Rhizobium leguminosarum TaxID=384 RepID=A0AAE2MHV0_RHILE|nr:MULTISPECIES: nitrile hydratase accessory protein [Rhizobium]MBB4289610.1 nitrile hydratase accessory protein [Rhizobium leguminosarum]MBB4296254.1 nitrile hydratase accessory protein [Rhizobium leguminosarum]MBB4308486.1 nitrile hydratase accessory protein [Rhizobium leguminosarum]MBB4416322.1 nitrile hydratase accessory protein [Rhizobium leguminosarum]MBB4430711.1 nitrile hydratase accessory protein [Rhizobium esperanzae]